MKSYRLSLQAEQTLESIIGWTIDNFGIAQALNIKINLKAVYPRLPWVRHPMENPVINWFRKCWI